MNSDSLPVWIFCTTSTAFERIVLDLNHKVRRSIGPGGLGNHHSKHTYIVQRNQGVKVTGWGSTFDNESQQGAALAPQQPSTAPWWAAAAPWWGKPDGSQPDRFPLINPETLPADHRFFEMARLEIAMHAKIKALKQAGLLVRRPLLPIARREGEMCGPLPTRLRFMRGLKEWFKQVADIEANAPNAKSCRMWKSKPK